LISGIAIFSNQSPWRFPLGAFPRTLQKASVR
jgi:hypothetical protein